MNLTAERYTRRRHPECATVGCNSLRKNNREGRDSGSTKLVRWAHPYTVGMVQIQGSDGLLTPCNSILPG